MQYFKRCECAGFKQKQLCCNINAALSRQDFRSKCYFFHPRISVWFKNGLEEQSANPPWADYSWGWKTWGNFMYLLNSADIRESEANNTVKSIFLPFFSELKASLRLCCCAEFSSSSETLYCLLLIENVHAFQMDSCIMGMWCINRAMSVQRVLRGVIFYSNCVSVWRMPLCFQTRLFNTHFRGGLSAYGILAGWVCFPWDARG